MIDLGEMALLTASAAIDEGTKQQSTTKDVRPRVSADEGAAVGGRRALKHLSKCILLHYIIFYLQNQLHL